MVLIRNNTQQEVKSRYRLKTCAVYLLVIPTSHWGGSCKKKTIKIIYNKNEIVAEIIGF